MKNPQLVDPSGMTREASVAQIETEKVGVRGFREVPDVSAEAALGDLATIVAASVKCVVDPGRCPHLDCSTRDAGAACGFGDGQALVQEIADC